MNSAQIHIALNHIPLIGTIFAVLILGYSLVKRSEDSIKIGLLMLLLSGFISIPVFLSGEQAEEIVEKLPGVSGSIIDQHQHYANYALTIGIFSGIAAALSLIFSIWNERKSAWLLWAVFFLGIITNLWMFKTTKIGEQIRHTENHETSSILPNSNNEPVNEK